MAIESIRSRAERRTWDDENRLGESDRPGRAQTDAVWVIETITCVLLLSSLKVPPMNATDLRAHWSGILNANRDYLHQKLNTDPFAKWKTCTMPESVAERAMFHGIQILLAEPENPDGFAYLRRCLTVVERAKSDDICQSKRSSRVYPANYARILRAQAFSEFFLGMPANPELIREASRLLALWSSDPSRDDDVTRAYHLGAVRLLLLIGEHVPARDLLGSCSAATRGGAEAAVLDAYGKCREMSTDCREAGSLLGDLVNQVRNPFNSFPTFIESDVLAIELAWLDCSLRRNEHPLQVPPSVILNRMVD